MMPHSLILDILFPQSCAGCGKPVTGREHCLCGECERAVTPIIDACTRCSGHLDRGSCQVCGERAFHPSRNITIAEYEGAMKKTLHEFKFGGTRGLHAPLGRMALTALARHDVRTDLITWVPMNARKLLARGYNQSRLIARYLSRRTGIPGIPLLAESRAGRTQRDMVLRERFINALGRYRPRNAARLRGRTVLLVDDVFTTGATINECARILRLAGAKDVISLTMARSDIKRLEKIKN